MSSFTAISVQEEIPVNINRNVDASIDYNRNKFELSSDKKICENVCALEVVQSCRYSVSKLLEAYYKQSAIN